MKNILNLLLSSFFITVTFLSCKKGENKIFFEGGTAPALSSSVSDSIPLSNATSGDIATILSWTNPDYQFTTGISSQDVSYKLEIDTAGSNFTNPGREIITLSKDLSITFTQSQFNDYLLNQFQLKPGTSITLKYE